MPSQLGRTATAVVALVYALQTVALAVLLIATGARSPLPIVATFGTDASTAVAQIATVDLGWGLVTVLAGGAVTFGILTARARKQSSDAPLSRVILLAGWSQGSAIIVFLVARLNGIAEVTSLVPLYAIAASAVALQGIDRDPAAPTWQRPGAWAAAIGIVPWGVIAFAQIGAGIAVGQPTLGVRIVTLLALAVAVLGWVIAWRRPASPRTADLVAMTVGVSLVVWTMVLFESAAT